MRNKIGIILVVFVSALLLLGFTKDYYFKINKSFDIFGAIFREVTSNYVLEIDPEILIKGAIQGMLSTLDPYTDYYDVDNREDFDMLTEGTYTGFGISISNIDSMLTITQVRDGYSASEAGLRIGDRICYVDEHYLLYKDYNSIRDVLKGNSGTKAKFRIIRDGLSDTLDFELVRKQISLDNISYFDYVDSTTAYIKLERFSKNAAQDFRFALSELKKKGSMESLIIDLRDNPGGLLDAAVQISEIFLPYESLIVSTKGRNNEELYKYKSISKPTEPDLPLTVLINENSASASEIIAGALQDYDRAVIIGKRSYGKGLVQTILPLPFKNNLKITTAKYYIPSGRCIQRIKFGEKYQENSKVSDSPDSTVFYTMSGRPVYESTGINPDTSSKKEDYSNVVMDLYAKFYFFKFANQYSAKLSKLPEDFKADDKLFNDFMKFLSDNNYTFKSESRVLMEQIKSIYDKKKTSKSFDKEYLSMLRIIEKEDKDIIIENKQDILEYLDFEVRTRFLSERDLIREALKIDNDLVLAKNILNSQATSSILSPKNSKSNQ